MPVPVQKRVQPALLVFLSGKKEGERRVQQGIGIVDQDQRILRVEDVRRREESGFQVRGLLVFFVVEQVQRFSRGAGERFDQFSFAGSRFSVKQKIQGPLLVHELFQNVQFPGAQKVRLQVHGRTPVPGEEVFIEGGLQSRKKVGDPGGQVEPVLRVHQAALDQAAAGQGGAEGGGRRDPQHMAQPVGPKAFIVEIGDLAERVSRHIIPAIQKGQDSPLHRTQPERGAQAFQAVVHGSALPGKKPLSFLQDLQHLGLKQIEDGRLTDRFFQILVTTEGSPLSFKNLPLVQTPPLNHFLPEKNQEKFFLQIQEHPVEHRPGFEREVRRPNEVDGVRHDLAVSERRFEEKRILVGTHEF